MNSLIPELISIISPRCQNCNVPATRMAIYNLCSGESYFCDDCSPKIVKNKTPRYSDLPHSKCLRNIAKGKSIKDDDLIKDLLLYLYPKCNKCNKAATRSVSSPSKRMSCDWIFFCDDHASKDIPIFSKIDFLYKDLPGAEIIRKAIAAVKK